MKSLIAWVMKGRTQAIMAAFLTAVLALLFNPLALVSAAVVVLATLRNGAQEGLLVVVAALVAAAAAGGLLFGQPFALALMWAVLWLPAWGLAVVYGRSQSLSQTLEVGGVGAVALIAMQYLLLGDPAAYWTELLGSFIGEALAQIDELQRQQLLTLVGGWMVGTMAVSWLLGMVLAIALGRWAQGVLADQPLLGPDFRAYRVKRLWLLLTPILIVVTFGLQAGQPTLAAQLFLVGMVLFLLQGISLVHALVKTNGGQVIWLVGLYATLFIGGPYGLAAVAAAGYADGWANFRDKLERKDDA